MEHDTSKENGASAQRAPRGLSAGCLGWVVSLQAALWWVQSDVPIAPRFLVVAMQVRHRGSSSSAAGVVPVRPQTPNCLLLAWGYSAGPSARLSSSFTPEDDRYVDDGDRRQSQQYDDEADRCIYQVQPDCEGCAADQTKYGKP